MKYCRRCSETKSIAEFNNSRSARDGLDTYCRVCRRTIVAEWRANNLEKSLAFGRAHKQKERARKGPEQVRREWNQWYADNTEHRREYQTDQRDPKKARAHNKLNKAIKSGNLIRPSQCSSCGKECRPDGHHPDYSKPLEVVWLCRSCHVLVEQNE